MTATLTNSTAEVAQKQLQFAGIDAYFDKVLSADTIKQLKPARSVYEMAAKEFGVDISEVVLIAAHSWDVAGAKIAGAKAAFISRGNIATDPSYPQPDFRGSTIEEVVDQILSANIK